MPQSGASDEWREARTVEGTKRRFDSEINYVKVYRPRSKLIIFGLPYKELSQFILQYADTLLILLQYMYVPRFLANLRNFEIALRILSIAKLRANFEIAYAISKLCNETTAQFRNGDVWARYASVG